MRMPQQSLALFNRVAADARIRWRLEYARLHGRTWHLAARPQLASGIDQDCHVARILQQVGDDHRGVTMR